jgi:hypothetical protein
LQTAHFFYDDGAVPSAAASAHFKDDFMKDGWGKLTVNTSAAFSDGDQAYAAGYLEGEV